jgi:menaquinone-dependent protoporphyrinogen oxidase
MHIVVAAASKHGATTEIAEAIATELAHHGLTVEVTEPGAVTSLERYDAVVLGSSVYAGRWQPTAKKMVERLAPALRERPVWLFSSGPLGDPLKPPAHEADEVSDMIVITKAREHRVFPGRIDKAKLNLGERAVVSALRAPVGDFRDWDEIKAWAGSIAAVLNGVPTV